MHAVFRTFPSLCGFIVFGPYILQSPRGKSNNSILVQNNHIPARKARHRLKHLPKGSYRKWYDEQSIVKAVTLLTLIYSDLWDASINDV